MTDLSHTVIDTIENFLDTCPDLEGVEVDFSKSVHGNGQSVVRVHIGDHSYLVTVTRLLGE